MRLADRYVITRLIGHGGMGTVYEAQHATIQRRFALKFLLPEYSRNAEMLRRFENEARAAGRLEHINIAAVTDFGHAEDGSPYLVMEYLPGDDCAAQLEKGGAFSVERATNIVYQACLGLSVAHQAGIVHRDIKPENLFILKTGEGEDIVKLLDFGIAKLRSPDLSAMTASGVTMGTIFYMSPEQIRDSAKVDHRSDVWALGIVLYELLTNQRPFGGGEVAEAIYQIVHVEPRRVDTLRPGLPIGLVDTIHRALEKDPNKRIATADAMAEALRPFTNRSSLHAPRIAAALDDTVASADGIVRRQASTSQLGATEIPSTPRPRTYMRWGWVLLGVLALEIVVLAQRSRARAFPVGPGALSAQPARPSTEPATDTFAVSRTLSPAVTVPQPSEPAEGEQVRATIGLSSDKMRRSSPSPKIVPVSSAPPASASVLAPPTALPVSPPPRKSSAAPGATITIDPRNPF